MNLLQLCDDLHEKIGDEIKLQPKYKFKKTLQEISENPSHKADIPFEYCSHNKYLTMGGVNYETNEYERIANNPYIQASPYELWMWCLLRDISIRWSQSVPRDHFEIEGIWGDGETWVSKDYTDKILEIAHNEGIHSITRQILNPTLLRDVKRRLNIED